MHYVKSQYSAIHRYCFVGTYINFDRYYITKGLPQIAHDFAPRQKVKMIISIFMIGQFTTVLLWGTIADHKKIITPLLGMLIFLLVPFSV